LTTLCLPNEVINGYAEMLEAWFDKGQDFIGIDLKNIDC
jgi:hypothetical protein